MNKSIKIIGACALTLSIASIPMSGAFAATTASDAVSVTIASSCTIARGTGTGSYSVDILNSRLNSSVGTSTFNIVCNDASGWNVTAKGNGTASHTNELYSSGLSLGIATGTATSGDTSNWAFKVTGTGSVAKYNSFTSVPATADKVASSSSTTSGTTLTATYQVWVSSTQAAGTYTGKVTYTVAAGA